ncbi:glutamyl-tRNA synthetase [Lojkania enalia]|uniref:glutamate--tRNA ligase n=1 Tax=Lojkania enalia TaxID=147567 RepID=A0A9P4N0M3_9PLEO|nr:glutamyl-tRNA synthetase [Didymosphaeria enalia]
MAPAPQQLPPRFPCWCKAVYSWGGETKRDLGFIEGDLIECLNAGDGSWWMGRLKRDRRMVGLFPSNFVQVLDEDFQPWSRNASPMTHENVEGSISRQNSAQLAKQTPQKSKSMFRKPFTAYAAAGSPNPAAAVREIQKKSGGLSPNLNGSIKTHKPYSSMKRSSTESRDSAAPSPVPTAGPSNLRAVSPRPTATRPAYSRAISPAPQSHMHSHSRASSPAPHAQYESYPQTVSPAPHHQYQAYSRGPSPAPSLQYQVYSRGPSPALSNGPDSPPPPPPPHRVAYNPSRAPSPMPLHDPRFGNGHHTPEPPSPDPRAGSRGNFTPSPLTNAMNDVMSSLQDMSMSRSGNSPDEPATPPNIWSPEAFDQVYQASAKKARAQTALGIKSQTALSDEDNFDLRNSQFDDGPPQVHSYVQRMESRLRRMQQQEMSQKTDELFIPQDTTGPPPAVPPKNHLSTRPGSSMEVTQPDMARQDSKSRILRHRKSAYEIGRNVLGRTFTTKTNSTTTTHSSHTTNHSLMSGHSATNMSATSAGSYYRKKLNKARPVSVMDTRDASSKGYGFDDGRPETPFTGITYHSSHATQSRPGSSHQPDWAGSVADGKDPLGGLMAPKPKKSGFFRKMIDTAKTSAANARSTIATGSMSRPSSRATSRAASRAASRMDSNVPSGIAGGTAAQSNTARDMGLGGAVDWVQVRRDVNRSNSLSKNERMERADRCQMLDIPVLNPVDLLYESAEGDEGLDGLSIIEPTDFTSSNLALVDKSARFVNSIPLGTTPATLAQGYVCRPYRSDVQRLRAIFTWVSERISWEEDFEGEIDTRHVLQTKRGCSEEIAILVAEMCVSVGLHAEVIRGYLKTPGETIDLESVAQPNHFWNAVIVEGEWRIMDCSLAGPTNPKRSLYSDAGSQVADGWYFLARPMEICYTHVPLLPEQQHICPPQPHDILMALPCACPTFFKHKLQVVDFDTSLLNLDNLELAHIYINVPEDVECVAEVEARALTQDTDGDYFESGDIIRKPALAQAEWIGGQKRYTIKALLPGDEGHGVLKIYAGPRGLRHSNKMNPHSLAMGLPIVHTGSNPPYSFLTLHPTPHAQRHDLYVTQPQCANLALNNTFVFNVRQHPSSLTRAPDPNTTNGRTSPNPLARPASAMSMQSISISGSNYSAPSQSSNGSSSSSGSSGIKPAKLAIQTPSGKIIRLLRKSEHMGGLSEGVMGSVWETVIKIGERGTWRGLVLADRSARWCVFAQWEFYYSQRGFSAGHTLSGKPPPPKLRVRLIAKHSLTLPYTQHRDTTSLEAKMDAQIKEWQDRAQFMTALNLKAIEPALTELDAHLTLRSHIVGYALTDADTIIWKTLRENRVAYAYIKQGLMLNLSRWFRYIEEAYPQETKLPERPANMKGENGEQKKNDDGANYDIGLQDVGDGTDIVTRFPPEPSGYLHIGHAKAALLNDYFAHEKYKGTLLLRFDDTNPIKEKQEFQDAIVEDLALMGIKADKTSYTSDYFQELYEYCVRMIKEGNAYADDTLQDKMRQERKDGIPSERRDETIENNLARFEEMKKGTEEGLRWCIRAKMSVDDPNKAMRDPVIYRCSPEEHHRTGDAWNIYPTYDFCCPIVDSIEGVTHALRTTEYNDRDAQYQWFIKALKLRPVHNWGFARLNFIRTLLSKRKLTKIVNAGIVTGWDDPRMPTVRGIRRRGVTIPALREFILKQGPSKNIVNLDWYSFWATNKKHIDPIAGRYTAIDEEAKVPVTIIGAREGVIIEEKDKHTKYTNLGKKKVVYSSSVLLEQVDAASFSQDEEITLMNWGNAIVRKINHSINPLAKPNGLKTITGLELELYLQGDVRKTKKVTWLSTDQNLVPVELVEFDYLITKDKLEDDDKLEDFLNPKTEFRTKAVADCNAAGLKADDIIQFDRKGYFRIDRAFQHGEPVVAFQIPTGKI